MKIIASIVSVLCFCAVGMAQDLVYKPINPSFGGDTFNGPWMLSSADAQNKYKEDQTNQFKQQTDLERFKSNLNNQFLNRLSNALLDSKFGNGTGTGSGTGTGTGTGVGTGTGTGSGISNGNGGSLGPGSYVFGTLSVDIYNSNLGMVVDILDTDTGEQTQIIIPGS
jgi:curli production assembly/transport component CsgF